MPLTYHPYPPPFLFLCLSRMSSPFLHLPSSAYSPFLLLLSISFVWRRNSEGLRYFNMSREDRAFLRACNNIVVVSAVFGKRATLVLCGCLAAPHTNSVS